MNGSRDTSLHWKYVIISLCQVLAGILIYMKLINEYNAYCGQGWSFSGVSSYITDMMTLYKCIYKDEYGPLHPQFTKTYNVGGGNILSSWIEGDHLPCSG